MRKLTLTRLKTVVASAVKLRVYIEVEKDGELVLSGVPCSKAAELKNGGSMTADIHDGECRVFAVYDKFFPDRYHAMYVIPAGIGDVSLSAKARFSPFKGNPFEIFPS